MKVGIFVDVGNLYYCIGKAFPGRKLDYQKYLDTVTDRFGSDITATAYGTQLEREASKFITALRHIGYTTKWKKEKPEGRRVSWNVGLTVDALAHLFEVVIIGSSDSALLELVDALIEREVKVIVYAARIGRELKETGAEILEISEDILEVKCD